MNKLTLTGRLTKDIEVRYSKSGMAFATSSIAVNNWRKPNDDAMFLDVIAFDKTAEVMNQYLRKGSKVLLHGSLELDKWVSQDGQNRQKHKMIVQEMEMLDSVDRTAKPQGTPQNDIYIPDIDEDEIPF